MWYVRLLAYNGFVVLVDNHLNSDPTITRDVKLWASVRALTHNWHQLASLARTLATLHAEAYAHISSNAQSSDDWMYPTNRNRLPVTENDRLIVCRSGRE